MLIEKTSKCFSENTVMFSGKDVRVFSERLRSFPKRREVEKSIMYRIRSLFYSFLPTFGKIFRNNNFLMFFL